MKKSLNDLIETVKELDGYREQSLVILEYLKSNGVVCKEKIKISEDAGDLCALDEYYWHFYLKDPTCDRYYDSQVVGSRCVKNMCINILQAVKEEKIDLVGEELYQFVSEFISLINIIFPEGQGDNLNVYLHQGEDFGLSFNPNRDTPSLYEIRSYRSELFTTLIEALIGGNNLSTAIKVFKQYSSKYNLNIRSLLVNIKNPQALNALNTLNDFDLKYLLAGIDAEQLNIVCRKDAYLKTVKRLNDSGWKLQSPTSDINEALLKEISNLNDTFLMQNLNEEQRYHLSILVREYDEFKLCRRSSPAQYEKWLTDLRKIIEEKLIDIENSYEKKLLADFNKGESEFKEEELKSLFQQFLKACEKCKGYPGYENFVYDYEKLYDKVKANAAIVKRVAAAQYRFSKIEEFDLGEGDFTNLVVVQVKVIERYLKEVIAQNMTGTTISSSYNFKDKIPNSGAKYYKIKKDDSANDLSSHNSISIELATAGFIVGSFGWEKCSAGIEDNKFFTDKQESGFNYWVQTVRNGYFHIHPVKSMEEAREIHYKTAFCLMRCIYLLKRLDR